MNNLRAISLWQPWASAMAMGMKKQETRSWFLGHRGDLVICSSKRKPLIAEVGEDDYETALALPYGCAVCVVEVVDCIKSDLFHGPNALPLSAQEQDLGDYAPGRWIWLTQNLRKLKRPVPVRGHQGLWFLDESANEAVLSMLA